MMSARGSVDAGIHSQERAKRRILGGLAKFLWNGPRSGRANSLRSRLTSIAPTIDVKEWPAPLVSFASTAIGRRHRRSSGGVRAGDGLGVSEMEISNRCAYGSQNSSNPLARRPCFSSSSWVQSFAPAIARRKPARQAALERVRFAHDNCS